MHYYPKNFEKKFWKKILEKNFEKILKKKNFQKKDYEYKMCKEPSQYMPKMRNNTADCISKKKH